MGKDINASRDASQAELGMRLKEATRASQTATDVFDEALTNFLGINRTDGRCLDIIDRSGLVSAGQLAIDSGLTTGAVTAVVDRLEKAGYVRRIRDSLDRRKVWIEVTEECRSINRSIFGFYARISPQLLSRFSEDQQRAVLTFLEISMFLNGELAAAIKEQLGSKADSIGDRVEQAKMFERAMELNEPRLINELDRMIDGEK